MLIWDYFYNNYKTVFFVQLLVFRHINSCLAEVAVNLSFLGYPFLFRNEGMHVSYLRVVIFMTRWLIQVLASKFRCADLTLVQSTVNLYIIVNRNLDIAMYEYNFMPNGSTLRIAP